MSKAQESKKIYWIIAAISFVAFVLFLIFNNSWFWLTLPFLLTSLVLALDRI